MMSEVDPNTPVTPVVESPPATEEKHLPQSVVNALIAREKRAVEERAARDRRVLEEEIAVLKAAPKSENKPPTPPAPDDTVRSELEALRAQVNAQADDAKFERHVAGRGLSDNQKVVLRKLWNPTDTAELDAFIAEMAPPPAREPAVAPPVIPIGAPGGAPDGMLEMNALRWSKDHIDRMRQDGTFLKRLDDYRQSLPGGSGQLPFRRKLPG